MNRNPQVDAYIAKAAAFAKPILERLRRLFHDTCPRIEEKIKWGWPSFEYKGMVGGFAAFQRHATFGFWRQDVLPDPKGLFTNRSSMGIRLTDVSQLPPDAVLRSYIRAAVKLNESGVPPRARKSKPKPPLKTPSYLLAALRKNRKAQAAFEAFSPSRRREYVEWIAGAKQEETRQRRMATAIVWMAEGKPLNWKYERK